MCNVYTVRSATYRMQRRQQPLRIDPIARLAARRRLTSTPLHARYMPVTLRLYDRYTAHLAARCHHARRALATAAPPTLLIVELRRHVVHGRVVRDGQTLLKKEAEGACSDRVTLR